MMPRLLLIDDDPIISEMVTLNLEHAGYQVSQASDGIKGQALAIQLMPDMIILDLMLPRVDGFTVCQRLRRDERTKETLLRRTNRIIDTAKHGEILIFGSLTLVPERFEAIWFNKTVKLTHLEFELLHCLLQRHGQTVSPSEILKEVWGYEPDDDIETIRVHIRHLRTKLEPDPRHPKYIKTVYGAGYCLELPHDNDTNQVEDAIAE